VTKKVADPKKRQKYTQTEYNRTEQKERKREAHQYNADRQITYEYGCKVG